MTLEETAKPSSGDINTYNDEKITKLNAQDTETLTNAIKATHETYGEQ